MPSWRDEILKNLDPEVRRLTLVADPDGLLLEERMLKAIEDRGFKLITFEDHAAFRFTFESQCRVQRDRRETRGLVVLVRVSDAELESLPYDLLESGRRLSFNLGALFPKLSYPVAATLDSSHLDALYSAQRQEPPAIHLGNRETREFILRHVFGVAPETIRHEVDLVRFLLHRHYRGLRVPSAFDRHLVDSLLRKRRFREWPLDRIVPDREAFLGFLQERWPAFLDRVTRPAVAREPVPAIDCSKDVRGLVDVPFSHQDVRIYIDNLFQEGLLKQVSHPSAQMLASSWAIVGVKTDPVADHARRLRRLLKIIEGSIPQEAARHQEWIVAARRWAELNALVFDPDHQGGANGMRARYERLRDRIDESFTAWLADHFSTLHNQPPVPPVMLHHVPRLLVRRIGECPEARVALVLVDGLALQQWAAVRRVLEEQRPRLRFREGGVFAWIPTLTSVSRQACFAGRPPLYFPSTIATTSAEPSAWRRVWADEGLPPLAVAYEKKLGDGADLARVAECVKGPNVSALALVVDKVDRILHGMVMGSTGMQVLVRQWAKQGMLANLLDMLLDHGFQVFLTSDHGNVETRGCGRPQEGVLVDTHGKRVRVYSDPVLRDGVKRDFPEAIAWPPIGLPEGYHPLIAPGRRAFVREGESPVAHGGISLEEVIVPLVEIERS